MVDWIEQASNAQRRYEDGAARMPMEPDERQRQLTRMGNAAWAAGISFLMLGGADDARMWLARAADTYFWSWVDAPPESWGRPIGALKSRLIAGDLEGARKDATWALEADAGESVSPIGRYAAALAHLVLGEDAEAGKLARTLRGRDDFPRPVAEALASLSAGDAVCYEAAVRDVLADFESRDQFLEDIPAADTVLALQALATPRMLAPALSSPLLPA